MDLSKGISLNQHNYFEIQQLWTPTTPAKLSTASSQRSQLPGPSYLEPPVNVSTEAKKTAPPWEFACQLGSSSSSSFPNYLQDVIGSQATALASSGHATTGSIVMLYAPATSSSKVDSLEQWSPLLSGNVNAACNLSGTSEIAPCAPLLVQFGGRQEMPAIQNMLLPFNGNVILAACLSNSTCSSSGHKDQYRIPDTCLPNLNSLPECLTSDSRTMETSAPQTPATTEKYYRRMQDKQPSTEGSNLIEGGARGEYLMQKKVTLSPLALEKLASVHDINVVSEEMSNQLIGVEKSCTQQEDNGIDLNVTPQKRTQRKKHRPKVIIEGKSSRTPKPATPQPGTHKQGMQKENTSCKRKYVRRMKDVTSTASTLNALGEVIDPESRARAKSARRFLNFDLEESNTSDDFSAAMSMFRKVLGDHVQQACDDGAVRSSGVKEIVNSTREQDHNAVNFLRGTVSDLNSSTYQSHNECSKMIEIPAPATEVNKNMGASEKHMSTLKSSVNRFKNLARKAAYMKAGVNPESSSEAAQSNLNCNRISDSSLEGTRRENILANEALVSAQKKSTHSYNLRGFSSKNYDARMQAPCMKGIHKRIRTEKGELNEAASNFSSTLIYTTNIWKMTQLSNNSHAFTLDAQSSIAKDKQASIPMLSFKQTKENAHNNLSVSSKLAFLSGIRGYSTNSSHVKSSRQKNKDIIQPPTPQKLSVYNNCLENKICKNQAHLKTSEDVNKHIKAKTRKGMKKQYQVQLLNLMPSSTKQTCLEGHETASDGNSPVNTIADGGGSTLTTRSLNGKNINPEIISLACQSTSCFKVSAYSSISFGALVPFIDPVDDIAQRLRRLHISRCHEFASSQAENAVVPYVGHKGLMIPYDRNFLTKRRRPRAKVDLDPESNRVWKLLMGKDDNEGDNRADVDKEKWWEEERRVFKGRVDSFIARMHLVQGDRRFSQWKGSVVDSVVGVFLTQNVSDHLSSSAFMALAANFPLQLRSKFSEPYGEKGNSSMENQNRCIISLFDPPELQRNLFDHGFCFHNSSEINVIENEAHKESNNCGEIIGCGTGNIITNYCKVSDASVSRSGTTVTVTGSTSLADMEDIRLLEDVISSRMSAASSRSSMWLHSQSSKHNRSNSFSKFEAENLLSGSMTNALSCSSFTQLIRMAESSCFEEFCGHHSGTISEIKPLEVHFSIENNPSVLEQLDNSKGTCRTCRFDSNLHHGLFGLSDMLPTSQPCQSEDPINSKIMENNVNHLKENIRAQLHSTSYDEISGNKFEVTSSESEESTSLLKLLSSYKTTNTIDSYAPICGQPTQQITFSDMEVGANLQSDSHHKTAENIIDASKNENPHVCSTLQTEDMKRFQQKDVKSVFTAESIHDADQVRDQIETRKNQESTASNNFMEHKLDSTCKVEKNLKYESYKFLMISPETTKSGTKPKKNRLEIDKNTYDWESLRKGVRSNKTAEGRSNITMDSLDWEAVRTADLSKIAETIRERGMNNKLAERIKDFLNRLVREHGTIDLEWLRDVPPDKAKDFLLSIRGLGLKSAECVRLLTLQHLAFPVDTNVGRICVRLGWVPLQPLPESLQLHLLELYPVLETIQKYLWPRLCKLDQRTLYELHYQMITFGKVFCTKSKPNCNSCPMRGECKHFASAFASARLALPGPEDKRVVSFTAPIASEKTHTILLNPRSVPQLEGGSLSQEYTFQNNCGPIVEEPVSPEPQCPETMESAIEDAFYEEPDEIPTIKLNFEEFTQNLQCYMQENMELQYGSLSKALVALTPEAASIPMPKLKNVTRLRTEHQVYEIPDSHPMLEGLDPREPDDPSPYLLALWTPGETAQSTEAPKACCNSQDTGQLCDNNTCFGCNSIRESESLKVRGTLLIPCRTAMRGSFPLNGTYFQVNEVFADHHSSCNPVNVPRDWIWNLPRRTVYFGTSIPTIFRGLTTEGIQQCFWRGFVCVRGFDRVTRAPKPLYARLHFPASKAPRNRKAAATAETSATAVTTTRESEQRLQSSS